MKFDVGILAGPVPTIVKQVQLAESLGYDTAWIADSHLVCRELWVTLTAEERVRQVMTVPRIGRIIVLPQAPGAGFIAREHHFTLFAEEVMARVA